eukprot:3691479-Rhodomonas_salina.2
MPVPYTVCRLILPPGAEIVPQDTALRNVSAGLGVGGRRDLGGRMLSKRSVVSHPRSRGCLHARYPSSVPDSAYETDPDTLCQYWTSAAIR